jgi:hypothetical protein
VNSDILEQKHFHKNGTVFSDYEMVIKTTIQPDQIKLIKVIFVDKKPEKKDVVALVEAK